MNWICAENGLAAVGLVFGLITPIQTVVVTEVPVHRTIWCNCLHLSYMPIVPLRRLARNEATASDQVIMNGQAENWFVTVNSVLPDV